MAQAPVIKQDGMVERNQATFASPVAEAAIGGETVPLPNNQTSKMAAPRGRDNYCSTSSQNNTEMQSYPIRSSTVDEYDRIVAQVTAASRAESTVYKYSRALVGWKDWCTINQVSQIPATAEDISRYMLYMYQCKAPYSRIESFFYALKWQYDCRPNIDNNPCDKNFLHIVLQGLKRLLYKPVVKKEVVTPEILRAIIDNNGASNDLIKVRLCAMVLLAYAAFLRHDELINIRRCDLEIFVSHINIFIMKSKMDIYRQGAWVIVGATNSPTCPVAALNKYLRIAGLNSESDDNYLFRPLNFSKSTGVHVLREGQLSYTRCLELFREALDEVGVDSKKFGLHSLRSGGASAAANFGVPDRLFKKHGRWKSETAKDGYVKDSTKDRLAVSLNLGL
ncbi:integrase/recombinase xerD homolog [Amphiura filiformis]|uniref:integrase/recombinase xerD homolog n=1 Tax=Amphiura filiformis TaxID=82378 RepID=UPI003B20DB74